MKDYLASNAVDKMPEGIFQPTDFAAVQFTINESGEVVDAQVFESVSELHPHDEANAILLEAVRQMPSWEPAEFCKGTTISQNYVFVVGNLLPQQSYNFQIGLSIEKFGQLRLLFLLHSNRFA